MILFGLALAARLPLIWAWPAVHGGDAVARLAHSDTLVLAYQLPLPQALVMACRALAPDPFWTRLVFSVVGALVPVALALALGRAGGARAGILGGALLAVHPVFIYYSVVPYQESPMLLCLLAGCAALQAGRVPLAAILFGLACLCRYEAWLAAALVGTVLAVRRRSVWPLVAFLWAPLAWVVVWSGLGPPGTYVLDLDPSARRLQRLPYLFGKLREYSGLPFLGLAFSGALVALRRRLEAVGWAASYVAGFALLIGLAGHEWPPGSGVVSERLLHVPGAAACALGGLALAALLENRGPRSWRTVLVAAAVGVLALGWQRQTRAQVATANQEPSLRLAWLLARVAERHLAPGQTLAVMAPPVPAAAIEDYVRKVVASGRSEADARALAARLGEGGPDRALLAAHLARTPSLVRSYPTSGAALVAVYDDAPGRPDWLQGEPLAHVRVPPRVARIYRVP